MDRRQYATMALMAGLGILAAGVAVIASRARKESHSEGSTIDAVRAAAELIRLRLDGGDSGPRRRALKAAAGRMKPELAMSKALEGFAEGNLEAAVKEPAISPFAHGVRGWMLVELGRRPEAAEEFKRALKDAPEGWEFRPLFEEALRKAEP
jgi:hypothetical protein